MIEFMQKKSSHKICLAMALIAIHKSCNVLSQNPLIVCKITSVSLILFHVSIFIIQGIPRYLPIYKTDAATIDRK